MENEKNQNRENDRKPKFLEAGEELSNDDIFLADMVARGFGLHPETVIKGFKEIKRKKLLATEEVVVEFPIREEKQEGE